VQLNKHLLKGSTGHAAVNLQFTRVCSFAWPNLRVKFCSVGLLRNNIMAANLQS